MRVRAASVQQAFATNTPRADGNIFYTVQNADNCNRIAALYGITLASILELNKTIKPDCSNLLPGQEILVGTVSLSATPAPAGGSATAQTDETPTADGTSQPDGTSQICVLIYDDVNGDALHQLDEPGVAGGAVSVSQTTGVYSKSQETTGIADADGYAGVCFTDVPPGTYDVAAAIPDNYNKTTAMELKGLQVDAGAKTYVDFGAQSKGDSSAPAAASASGGGTSAVAGILGLAMLLAGLGLGWYALRLRNPIRKAGRGSLLKR